MQTEALKLTLMGKKENVFNRSAPCNGVKKCSSCDHVQQINQHKNSCKSHPNSVLEKTTGCSVVFVYIFPENYLYDNRR